MSQPQQIFNHKADLDWSTCYKFLLFWRTSKDEALAPDIRQVNWVIGPAQNLLEVIQIIMSNDNLWSISPGLHLLQRPLDLSLVFLVDSLLTVFLLSPIPPSYTPERASTSRASSITSSELV